MTIQTPPEPDAPPQWGEPGYHVPRRKLSARAKTIVALAIIGAGLALTAMVLNSNLGAGASAAAKDVQIPDPPVIAKNERQMETASKVRSAHRLKEAKAEWAAEARRAAREKARQAAIEREREPREAAAAEAARPSQAPDNQYGVPQDWVPCGVTGAYCPPPSGPPTCPEGQNYVPYAGKCVWGDW